jgi:UDP-N-acetylglucosamine--N-acetylmuramyl-(pentapeptide) pyrophosphoryl-undecaprenol N-acetylglucosamine transferase
MKVAFAGGGTAGHLFPALAVAQRFLRLSQGGEACFLAANRPLDRELLEQYQLTHRLLSAEGLPYGLSWKSLPSLARIALGSLEAYQTLTQWQPQAIFATGGYISAASVPAARLRHIPAIIHVSDALPDRTSLRLARRVQCITLAFAEAASYFPADRVVVTGQPVREEVLQADRAQCRAALGLTDSDRLLLVTGGSQGSMNLNLATVAALPALHAAGVSVLHLAGTRDYPRVQAQLGSTPPPAYHCLPFEPQMSQAYAAADLILMRAGSSSIAEAAAWGLPMILVPYPHAHGHQRHNALPLVERGAAQLIADEALTADTLTAAVLSLLADPSLCQAMSQAAHAWGSREAADRIAALLLTLAG